MTSDIQKTEYLMKILLAACNAKYIHSNLAVYNLRAYAKKYRQQILLREYTINERRDEVLKDIYINSPEVVCFSCYIWNISFIKGLLPDLARILPGTAFWFGGPEVSFDAEDFLRENPDAAGVMVGEGEETFLELAEYYLEKAGGESTDPAESCRSVHRWELRDIAGIAYRDDTGIHYNGWREILDLDRVPFAYEDLEDFTHRIIYYESSRGCPFSCSYCLSSVDKRLRFRSLELVKAELQFFIDRNVPQVKFVDRTFNCRHEHAMEIWKYIAEHDNGVTNFHFEISADLLREDELELMQTMRPGLIQLEIGVQSTNPRTIRAIRRTMDLDRLSEAVKRIHSFGNIHQHLDLIAGLPYENYESFHRSFNDVYALCPEQLQLGFLKVLKGAHMMEAAGEYGLLWQSAEPYEVLCTKWLSYREILQLKMVESMVEVYYNSGQFRETLKTLEEYFPDAFLFYQELGSFYEERGYSEISHSRLRRYELLLEFIRRFPRIPEEKVRESMLYDLYLRENLKSRPSFAPDRRAFAKAIHEYRRRENIPKTAHIEVFSQGRAVLFDYTQRDPLTNNAKTCEIVL